MLDTQVTVRTRKVEDEAKACSGLCTTCMHLDICTYPKDADSPVMFCEEFEVEKAPEARVVRSDEPCEEVPGKKNLKGLCLNCANAGSCTYPKPETGVWHCEEYL